MPEQNAQRLTPEFAKEALMQTYRDLQVCRETEQIILFRKARLLEAYEALKELTGIDPEAER